jgi:hypothetical protein
MDGFSMDGDGGFDVGGDDAVDARNPIGVALATRIVQLMAEDARGVSGGWAGVR